MGMMMMVENAVMGWIDFMQIVGGEPKELLEYLRNGSTNDFYFFLFFFFEMAAFNGSTNDNVASSEMSPGLVIPL